jgi:hypothetical protein
VLGRDLDAVQGPRAPCIRAHAGRAGDEAVTDLVLAGASLFLDALRGRREHCARAKVAVRPKLDRRTARVCGILHAQILADRRPDPEADGAGGAGYVAHLDLEARHG